MLNMVYHISEKVYSKFLFGRAFKAPTQRQLFDPPSGQPDDTRGNENLKPQYASTLECLLGYKYKETANFTITGFSGGTIDINAGAGNATGTGNGGYVNINGGDGGA